MEIKKEIRIVSKIIENAYKEKLQSHIDTYIILFGTKSLEKLLNEVFKDRQIKPIKIKLNYKLNKKPMKVIL